MQNNRPQRRHHPVLKLLAGLLLVGIIAALYLLRTPAPVGHWRSAGGHDAFMDSYTAAMADMPEPAEVLDVRTGFGVVRLYRFAGTAATGGAPLLLLPGRAAASPVWSGNLAGLRGIGDVYTVDLLGEPGMSVQERPISDRADQALWLHQVLTALPGETFHLVGLSIGGWTAANLAVRQPRYVASVTLIDPVFVFDSMPLETIVRSLSAALPWLPRAWRDSFNAWTAGGASVEDTPVARMIEAGMQHYAIRLPAPSRIGEAELGARMAPAFAIIAGESVMHDPATARASAERTMDRVAFYPDASHAVIGERSEEIATEIAQFIADVEAGRLRRP